jgi:sec-independent protein translocase protein TatB
MFGIGLPEMILILALALIVVGPDKLPDLARSLAKGVMELKKTAEGLKDQLHAEGNPLDDIRPDLEDAAKSFKSHMLDHPDNGKSDIFPSEGVNPPADNAANAYKELIKAGHDPRNVPMDNTSITPDSIDDLTEVVEPLNTSKHNSTTDSPEKSDPESSSDK